MWRSEYLQCATSALEPQQTLAKQRYCCRLGCYDPLMVVDPAWMRAIYPLLYGAFIFCLWKLVSLYLPAGRKRTLAWLAVIAGWAWCLFAGGGGFGLLLLRGPWPPTNGWFAMLSGLAACPLIGQLLRKSPRLEVSGWQQFGAAVLLVSLGRMALTVWPQPHPL